MVLPLLPSLRVTGGTFRLSPDFFTLGAKLNIGCGLSGAGYFVTYDDDDWHSPERVYR